MATLFHFLIKLWRTDNIGVCCQAGGAHSSPLAYTRQRVDCAYLLCHIECAHVYTVALSVLRITVPPGHLLVLWLMCVAGCAHSHMLNCSPV